MWKLNSSVQCWKKEGANPGQLFRAFWPSSAGCSTISPWCTAGLKEHMYVYVRMYMYMFIRTPYKVHLSSFAEIRNQWRMYIVRTFIRMLFSFWKEDTSLMRTHLQQGPKVNKEHKEGTSLQMTYMYMYIHVFARSKVYEDSSFHPLKSGYLSNEDTSARIPS